jgi:hypothetical protein
MFVMFALILCLIGRVSPWDRSDPYPWERHVSTAGNRLTVFLARSIFIPFWLVSQNLSLAIGICLMLN